MLPLPAFPYSTREIRSLCQSLLRISRVVPLGDSRLVLHRIIADAVGEGITSGVHTHSVYEGIILLTGRAEYATETAQALQPGNALLLAPFTRHAWRVLDGPCLRLTFEFTIDPALKVVPPPRWPLWPEILWDVALLLHDAAQPPANRYLLAPARLAAILARLLTLADRPHPPEPDEEAPMKFVEVVDTFLRENLARPLTVADVAYHAGMSERSLIRHFRQLAGETIVQRLFKLRMDCAAGLLVDTNASVSEIGARVGIPDAAYFCSRFRRYYQQTPQQFRRQATTAPPPAGG